MSDAPIPFFPEKHEYTAWIERMPAILQVVKGAEGDELLEEAEGPYFYDPYHLILRVRGYYSALVRVPSREEADFTWYVARNQDEGEEVYAALMHDHLHEGQSPAAVVGSESIQAARNALAAFLIVR